MKGLTRFEALVPAPECECDKSKEYVLHLSKTKTFSVSYGSEWVLHISKELNLAYYPSPKC